MRPSTLRWRVYVLVGAVLALLLVTVASTSLARLRTSDYNSLLRNTLRPAQASSAVLAKAYVDMETGVRGYLLSGETELLAPYHAGREAAEDARSSLGTLLVDDPAAIRQLRTIDSAAAEWERTLATPAVLGTVARPGTTLGQPQFDALRTPLAGLQQHIDQRTASTVQSSINASSAATMVTVLCAALALLCGLIIVVLLQRSLVRPVNHLVADVRRVSGGDLSHRVAATGPDELIKLGQAVESMRERILSESSRAARLAESDRIAQDLGSTTIRDLFGISLALHSAAARNPSAAPALSAVTADVDRVVREIRTKVFNTQRTVQEVVTDLPTVPTVSGAADSPAPPTLEPFLRDVLPLLPPATMAVATTETTVDVTITSGAPEDPTELKERAGDHAATVTNTPEHTVIEWSGPL